MEEIIEQLSEQQKITWDSLKSIIKNNGFTVRDLILNKDTNTKYFGVSIRTIN